jgi:hypothetical protein
MNARLLSAILSALLVLNATAAVLYVDVGSTNSVAPFADWTAAATNIQDAVDAASTGDLVLVTNGTYRYGGRALAGMLLTNRVVIEKSITVESALGSASTFIEGLIPADQAVAGDGAIRCAYLGSNAVLSGFTLTNGHTRFSGVLQEDSGGAVYCETSAIVRDCVLVNNAAAEGGAACGTLSNCTLIGNYAINGGGGAFGSRLYNCYLNGNSSGFYGGGVSHSILFNCVVMKLSGMVSQGRNRRGCRKLHFV